MADEKQKYENIKAALSDGRTRTIYIGGLVIVVVIAVFAAWSFASKKSAPRGGPASTVPALPAVQNSPSADVAAKPSTPVYDKLIQEQNQREAEKAKQEGGSAVPVMRAGAEHGPAAPSQPPQQSPTAAPQQSPYPDNREEEQKRQQATMV